MEKLDFNLDSFLEGSTTAPRDDVSSGDDDMAGSGWGAMFGTITTKALDYAIQRDVAKMRMPLMQQATQQQQVVQQRQENNWLLIGAVALGVFLLVRD